MSQNDYFIGNPNECAKKRLANAGISVQDTLEYGGISYTGARISRRCARKIYRHCFQNGDITRRENHAFHLFSLYGNKVIEVRAEAVAAELGLAAKIPSLKLQGFGRGSTMIA